jgi:hypothetical protein
MNDCESCFRERCDQAVFTHHESVVEPGCQITALGDRCTLALGSLWVWLSGSPPRLPGETLTGCPV